MSSVAAATAAGMAAQYLGLATAASIGGSVPLPNFPLPVIRDGKPMESVYARVQRAYERQVSKHGDVQRALEIAMRYATTLTDANVRFTEQATHRAVLTYLAPRIGVTGYRRIVHPELSRTGTCGLCLVASDQVYGTADLMPMHNLCKCTILPIVGDIDPGSSLNNLSLDELYAAGNDRPGALRAGGKSADGFDLKKVRYKVVDHTEYGPTLVDANHKFTAMGELVRSDDPDARQRRTGSTRAPGNRKPSQEQVDAAIAKTSQAIARQTGGNRPAQFGSLESIVAGLAAAGAKPSPQISRTPAA